MQTRHPAFKASGAVDWTKERIEKLSKQEVQQLGANATRLGESAIAELCGEVLRERPRGGAKRKTIA